MRIIIVGAGTIGTHLAESLAGENQEVVVIDNNRSRLEELAQRIDCQTEVGSGVSPELLDRVGISHTDLLVAVTDSDAVNLAVCHLAGSPRMNVPRAIARVRNPEFDCDQPYVASDHFSIDQFISPEGLAVKLIDKLLEYPGTVDAMTFDRQRLCVHSHRQRGEFSRRNERTRGARTPWRWLSLCRHSARTSSFYS